MCCEEAKTVAASAAAKTPETWDERLSRIETTLAQVKTEHDSFMDGLDAAVTELLSNSMSRVMLNADIRGKLESYLIARGKPLAKKA